MNILLDTHVLLWCLYEPSRLTDTARNIIMDPDNWICYSLISLWECEIKHLSHPDDFAFTASDVRDDCVRAGYSRLDLRADHIFSLHTLRTPSGLNHKDPFDKMLMSQAGSESMLLLTHDSRMSRYGLPYVKYI